ncbi:D-alanine--D-alanine ligase [Candidatus Photodesmus katoptron]|uniref:D-alanine--D-alanine ligase n=1 Tax=Candidatus Photodesmus katoptron Akat1 TaxID=1236703 RepID=S3DJK4_9GAMM|nr:D-alanine--D-alanine ligase [Candidatus Photodesmus katoptron]EPE37885.1 D-alanine--D-alanine ligase [Candidatus Photodesmus katoptron Akat1]KEY90396.1 D-alanine--D-alanine ligase [Candidatus Photodesmus katoptron]
MSKITVLLLYGGNQSEHAVSRMSANYLQTQLKLTPSFFVIRIRIQSNNWYDDNEDRVYLDFNKAELYSNKLDPIKIDFIIPCIHGYPGETGDIQSMLELAKIPYLGCGPEASINSFNKITSKLWYNALGIPNTPYIFLCKNSKISIKQGEIAFKRWGKVFVKAAKQGSSIGCYKVTNIKEIGKFINLAFTYSDQVLIEKALQSRELEVSAYEFNGKLYISKPGEILTPDNNFYSYKEKYNQDSKSITKIEASNLTIKQKKIISNNARKIFIQMKLKHLSRLDFFLTKDNKIYLNEVNTFPGMTSTSMFPKMLENNGHRFSQFLANCIFSSIVKN